MRTLGRREKKIVQEWVKESAWKYEITRGDFSKMNCKNVAIITLLFCPPSISSISSENGWHKRWVFLTPVNEEYLVDGEWRIRRWRISLWTLQLFVYHQYLHFFKVIHFSRPLIHCDHISHSHTEVDRR
jgi:hypothetical protein